MSTKTPLTDALTGDMSQVKKLCQELETKLERYHDLVRFMRSELHQKGLIDDDEYVALLADDSSVNRLQTYDRIRAESDKHWTQMLKVRLQLSHPTIHVEYYKWLELTEQDKILQKLLQEKEISFTQFHICAMHAWTQSRIQAARELAKETP